MKSKNEKALKTIGEVAELLAISEHSIRFWEENFSNLKPIKLNRRRYYSSENIDLIKQIQVLLHIERHSIKSAIAHFKKPIHPLLKAQATLVRAKEKLVLLLSKQSRLIQS